MSTMFTINPRRRSSIKQALVFVAVALCSFNIAVHGAPTPQQQPPAPGTIPENAQVVKLPSGEMSGMVPPVAFLPPTIDDPLPGERTNVVPTPTTTVSQEQETRQATITTIVPTSTSTPQPVEPPTDTVPIPTVPQLAAAGPARGGRAQVDSVSAADAATAAANAAAADGDVQAANLDLGRLIGAITGNGGGNLGRVIGAVTRGTTGIIGAANGDLSQIPGIIGAVTDGIGAVGDIVGDLNGDGQEAQPPVNDDQEEGAEEDEEAPAPGAGNRGRNVADGIGRAARTIGQIGQVGRQLGLFNANEAGQAPGVSAENDGAVGVAVLPQEVQV
ncbi:hypothetical protein BCR44DRAFT_1458343 [Catenaria anguillulae PL171]|uniref:Uncharacterized protein n=1 Tax=Catenaria anguillulae PL171 TaxID=765915 RepID=A0A1Y2HY61_9FUNG|nr:hypothetical protein BCR44DRAFT_1458343 [Catenaria anguillulae PL171]